MNLHKINKVILISLLSILAVSCVNRMQTKIEVVDPQLLPYVNSYQKLLGQYCPSKNYNASKFYEIKFVKELERIDKEHITIGMCTKYINGYMVEISENWWKETREELRDSLIYHELSHCILDKFHSKDPFNYMYESMNYIYPDVLVKQVVKDIEERCNK